MSSSTQPPSPPGPRPGPVLALVGPTAAGKTELALAVAERLGAEVVSADAMLVYRGMDIGTAKPTPEERARVPHHLVDLVDPDEEFSVARFQPLARAAIAEVLGRGRTPLLVGGSGLYFHAVVDDFVFPPTDQAVRVRLEAEAARVGLPELYRRLAAADPPAAARIQPANLRRTVRALEVMELTGRPFSSFRGAMDTPVSRYRLTLLGLDPGPEPLRARVAERVAAMAEAGLVEEVRRLAERPLSRTARQALGYKELLDAMEQGTPVAEALEAVVRRTRAYARRQLAWFRRDPRVRWSTLPPGPDRVAWALEMYGKG
jgi:tRNA dimethylallyltransferase